jgi:transcriptional regulator with XRE-family HTH domain
MDLIDLLWSESRKRTQKDVAKDLGISPQYLSDILKGRREISAEVARRLGFERVVTFVRFGNAEESDRG